MATLANNALTTLADVKESMGISSGDHTKDNLIIRKINQASTMIERYCDRSFKSATYTEYYDGDGGTAITLRNYPVTSLASLGYRKVFTNDNDFTTVNTNEYFLDADAGVIKSLNWLFGGYDQWEVVYTAGYTTIPSDLAEAAATLAGFLANTSTSTSGTGVKLKVEGQRRIEYFDPAATGMGSDNLFGQLGIDDILDTYADAGFSGLR